MSELENILIKSNSNTLYYINLIYIASHNIFIVEYGEAYRGDEYIMFDNLKEADEFYNNRKSTYKIDSQDEIYNQEVIDENS